MDITIRKAIKKDLWSLKKLTKKTIANHYGSFLKGKDVEDYINSSVSDREIEKGWKKSWTVLLDGKICGYAILQSGQIHMMMIDLDQQRKGLETALIQHCEELLLQDYDEITLECFRENRNACDFYSKKGWKIRETLQDQDQETGLNLMIFYKKKQVMNSLPTGLAAMGMNPDYENILNPELIKNDKISRVTGVRKNLFLVNDRYEERWASTMGKLHHPADETVLFPATGDWVVLKDGRIASVLPRKNVLSCGASGRQGKKDNTALRTQIIAANLDSVFIVCGLDRDFNIRRIERYLTLVYQSECSTVVILSKSDLHDSPDTYSREVE